MFRRILTAPTTRTTLLRAKANLKSKPTTAGKRATIKKRSKKDMNATDAVQAAAQLEAIVTPTHATRTLCHLPQTEFVAMHLTEEEEREKRKVIELAWWKECERRFVEKRDELERMHRKMKEACLDLEQTDGRLFQLAMVKPMGEYMPIERRIFTDTAPAMGWNHENRLSTAVFSNTKS